MYLTYSEYLQYNNGKADIDSYRFTELETEAEKLIDWYTYNRLSVNTTYSTAVKMCVNKLIKLSLTKASATSLGDTDDSANSPIKSQSNDGVSISYNVITANELFSICKKEMISTIQLYLNGETNSDGKRLTYRGLYTDE